MGLCVPIKAIDTGEPLGYSKKFGFSGRKGILMTLIFLLLGMGSLGGARAEDTTSGDDSGHEKENRLEEIQKSLEKAKNQTDGTSTNDAGQKQESRSKKAVKEQSGMAGTTQEKEALEPMKSSKVQKEPSLEKKVPETPQEESQFEYVLLENVTWEILGKKVILRLWISGQATPSVDVISDSYGMKIRLRPKGVATQMSHVLSALPPGVQSFVIREESKLAKAWNLEAPYYAIGEIQASFVLPVQCRLSQEPGLLKVTFLFPKKVEAKTVEPAPPPVETIQALQKKALSSPETTLGTSYQSQEQFKDRILYGPQKSPSISDLYKKELKNEEFKTQSELPEDVRPIFDVMHPSFGSAQYFKKYIHWIVSQTFNYATDYNQGSTSAFGQNNTNQGGSGGAGGKGKDISNILGTPQLAFLFYRPGTFDVSTGYSASRDFPTMRNNFVYGLDRQNISFGIAHYPKERYAFATQNDLGFFGGTTREKQGGKWLKLPAQHGYSLTNNFGLNYRLTQRLIWGVGAGMSRTRSETDVPGSRNRDLTGALNTYFTYQATPRLNLNLGTAFTHILKDTSGSASPPLTGPSVISTTKGKNLQSVFLSANYHFSKKLTLTGGIEGSLIDWDIPKIGGSAGITYQRTPSDSFSFQYTNSVVQDDTSKILARSVNTLNGFGISLQRVESMKLQYDREFDRGKMKGFLSVQYMKNNQLSDVFYGGTGNSGTINYDILFTASIRRALLKNRASIGLLYSYDLAPSRTRDSVTGKHTLNTNTSQNIIASVDYSY